MKRKLALIIMALALGLAVAIPAGAALAAPTPLPNGFTAEIIAVSGETITGSITNPNTSSDNFDVGVYIGPGVHDVTVNEATVSGFNDEGILVQDASDVLIENSTVEGNAVNAVAGLSEVKAIVLAGTRDSLVKDNTVEDNMHGGIGMYDDGPNSPFAPTAIDTVPVAGAGNVLTGNLVKDNMGDCGIVVSAKNPGGGVSNNVVSKNTVLGFNPAGGDFVPGVGGIVVAGGASGPVQVADNIILNNVVTGGFIPGISLHAFGPGVISGTQLIGNALSNNGAGELSGNTTGIEIFAIPHVGTIRGTQVLNDSVSNDHYGVWHVGDTGTHIANLTTSNVVVAVFPP